MINTLFLILCTCSHCRQLALKALNERLSKVDSPTSWPSLEEDAPETSPSEVKEEGKHVPAEKKDTPPTLPPLPVPDFKEAAKTSTS